MKIVCQTTETLLNVAGLNIAEVIEKLRTVFNVPDVVVLVNGREMEHTYRLKEEDRLEITGIPTHQKNANVSMDNSETSKQIIQQFYSEYMDSLNKFTAKIDRLSEAVEASLPIIELSNGPNPDNLSDSKKDLYDAASESEPKIGKNICQEACMNYGGYERGLLAELVRHDFLKKVSGGYLKVPPRQKS